LASGDVVLHLVFVVITVAKGKDRMALLGTFVPLLAAIGSIRLARPASRSTRRYNDDTMARVPRAVRPVPDRSRLDISSMGGLRGC
jgi:hypothetical protein